jgi:hypothetical protein
MGELAHSIQKTVQVDIQQVILDYELYTRIL